jgi:hypothetical protein
MSRQRWKASLSRSASAGDKDVMFHSGSKSSVTIIFAFGPPRKGGRGARGDQFTKKSPVGSIRPGAE